MPNFTPTRPQPPRRFAPHGFSLVEVLLAMFILGIGMIMVASVFPVGANWTREATEDSVAQTVVQNALTVIKTHYGPTGNLRPFMSPDFLWVDPADGYTKPYNANHNSILNSQGDFPFFTPQASMPKVPMPFIVQPLPGLIPHPDPDPALNLPGIPPNERAYQFGSSAPFPVLTGNLKNCTYFWTALARLNPMHRNYGWDPARRLLSPPDLTNGIVLSASYNYDIYILVFRKGAPDHQFSGVTTGYGLPADIPGVFPGTREDTLIPSVSFAHYDSGVFDGSNWSTTAVPPIGKYGIGVISGTVFKQVLNTNTGDPNAYTSALPRPGLALDDSSKPEPIVICPAADGTMESASPLIYIYQTSMTF